MKKLILIIFFSIFTFSVGANEIDDLTKLADDGDPVAQNNLVIIIYIWVIILTIKSLDKAIYYLNAAAEQEQVNAMTTVGWTISQVNMELQKTMNKLYIEPKSIRFRFYNKVIIWDFFIIQIGWTWSRSCYGKNFGY